MPPRGYNRPDSAPAVTLRVVPRLRELRGERSLRALERESGVNRAVLSQVERGLMLPRRDQVPALEAAYGAPASEWYRAELVYG